MPLVTTAELMAEARTHRVGVAAFNVITIEHAEAISRGAAEAGGSAILQISQNAVRYHGGDPAPLVAACTRIAEGSPAKLSLHLDHVDDLGLLHRASALGCSSVMYDASLLPYSENVASTRAATEWAHSEGLYVESELGEIGGKDGVHGVGVRTDPDDAAEYVAQTGIDALAVAVGTSHAMTSQTARLDQELIVRLRDAVPVPLVLHGSSGVAPEELTRAISGGIIKINIGTLLNVAFTAAVRAHLSRHPQNVDPRKYLEGARNALADAVCHSVRTVSREYPADTPLR